MAAEGTQFLLRGSLDYGRSVVICRLPPVWKDLAPAQDLFPCPSSLDLSLLYTDSLLCASPPESL